LFVRRVENRWKKKNAPKGPPQRFIKDVLSLNRQIVPRFGRLEKV
jgi:hypothetical protein